MDDTNKTPAAAPAPDPETVANQVLFLGDGTLSGWEDGSKDHGEGYAVKVHADHIEWLRPCYLLKSDLRRLLEEMASINSLTSAEMDAATATPISRRLLEEKARLN